MSEPAEPRPATSSRPESEMEGEFGATHDVETVPTDVPRDSDRAYSPTLIERAARRLHLPFPVLAALIAIALSIAVPQTVLPGTGSSGGDLDGLLGTRLDLLVTRLILFSLFFYVILVRRSVRLRTIEVGRKLPHVEQDPDTYFHQIAARSHGVEIPLTATAVGCAAFVVAIVLIVPSSSGLYNWNELPVYAVFTFLRFFALAAAAYTFAVVSRGMYQYARRPLAVASYFDDPALGLGPLGTLTISLIIYYVILLALLCLWASVSSNVVITIGVIVALAVLGLVLFLLPLRVFHGKMLAEKNRALAQVRHRMRIELQRVDLTGSRPSTSDPANILAIEAIERRIEGIRTWPFETGAAESLFSGLLFPIILSITAGVLLHFLLGG